MDNNQPTLHPNQSTNSPESPPDPLAPIDPAYSIISTPSPTPTPNQNTQPAAKSPMNKFMIIGMIAGGFILLLVIGVLIIASSAKKTSLSNPPKKTIETKKDDELVTVLAKDIYIDKKRYDLSITTPYGWGTAQNNNIITKVFPWEDAKFLTSFRFRDAKFSVNERSISANNYIALQDVSGWLTTDKNSYPLSAQAKRNNFDILGSLGAAEVATPDLMNKIVNPRNESEISGRVKPEIIKSSNGSVNGVSYLTITGNANIYAPRMILLMAGNINGRQIYLYGDLAFTDAQKVKLDKLNAEKSSDYGPETTTAIAEFKAGKLTAELQKFYEQSVIAFKSIKIERTNSDNILN